MSMARVSCAPQLILVFTFLLAFSGISPATSDSSATLFRERKLGFFYTRTKGKCTPQYWSSRREAWPRMVPQTSTVVKVFGSRAIERYRYDLTLIESTARMDDENAYSRLLKQATAALLNSYSRKGYAYSAWEVKTLLIQAIVSKEAAARQAQEFAVANEACN